MGVWRWQYVRVVKEENLKSSGLRPRRFESCYCCSVQTTSFPRVSFIFHTVISTLTLDLLLFFHIRYFVHEGSEILYKLYFTTCIPTLIGETLMCMRSTVWYAIIQLVALILPNQKKKLWMQRNHYISVSKHDLSRLKLHKQSLIWWRLKHCGRVGAHVFSGGSHC